jgi:hypothetical protein
MDSQWAKPRNRFAAVRGALLVMAARTLRPGLFDLIIQSAKRYRLSEPAAEAERPALGEVEADDIG